MEHEGERPAAHSLVRTAPGNYHISALAMVALQKVWGSVLPWDPFLPFPVCILYSVFCLVFSKLKT